MILDEFGYGANRTRTVRVVCPWIRKIDIFDFVYTLASANIDRSVPTLATIYMPIRFRMSSIMGQIEPEHPELFALEFGKIAEYDFVYTLSSTNINQSAPNLVKVYITIRSRMCSIMDLIGPEMSELFALELENLPYLTLFTSICKYWPSSTKLGQNIYANNVSDEFDYRLIWTRTSRVICINVEKLLNMTLLTFYHLQILTNQHRTWSECMWS